MKLVIGGIESNSRQGRDISEWKMRFIIICLLETNSYITNRCVEIGHEIFGLDVCK